MDGNGYSTQHELRFIDNIEHYHPQHQDRAGLLLKYVKAAKRRNNWGSMDSKKIIIYALDSLARCDWESLGLI